MLNFFFFAGFSNYTCCVYVCWEDFVVLPCHEEHPRTILNQKHNPGIYDRCGSYLFWLVAVCVGGGVAISHVGMLLPHDVRPNNSILHRLTLTNRDAIGQGFSEGDISFFPFFCRDGKTVVDTSHQIIVVVSLSFPFSLIHISHKTQIQYNTLTTLSLSSSSQLIHTAMSFGKWHEEQKAKESGVDTAAAPSWFSVSTESLPLFDNVGTDMPTFSGMKASLESQLPQKIMGMNYQQRFQVSDSLCACARLGTDSMEGPNGTK